MSKKTETIAVSVFCVLVVVVIFVVLFIGTNGFKTKPTAVYLQIGDNKYTADKGQLTIGNARVDVKYSLSKQKDFTYKIEPVGEDFTYIVDGQAMQFLEIPNLTNVLVADVDENGITLECLDKSILKIIQTLYPGQTVEVPTGQDDEYHFKLTVTSSDGKTNMSLTFRCLVLPQDIIIDPPSIVF